VPNARHLTISGALVVPIEEFGELERHDSYVVPLKGVWFIDN
jgi:hypothetical protein